MKFKGRTKTHLVRLGFSPENRKKVLNISTRFSMDCAFFRKNVLSSEYAE